jgi:hypothetical protein
VLILRSVKSIVIAPAKTGKDNNSSIAVIKTVQGYKGINFHFQPPGRVLLIVVIKLMAPNNEDTPAKCKLKIAKSTDGPA